MQAKAALPAPYQGALGRLGGSRAALEEAVVAIVRLAVPAAVPVMLTALVEPKLRDGGN
jgi:hypothetical protein